MASRINYPSGENKKEGCRYELRPLELLTTDSMQRKTHFTLQWPLFPDLCEGENKQEAQFSSSFHFIV